jgi:hypothetical protein
MSRPTIITTIQEPDGTTLVLYRHQDAYKVGVLSSHQRPIPLQDSSYETYEAAHQRLMQEAQKHQQARTEGKIF